MSRLEALLDDPTAFDLFAAIRLLEQLEPDLPRVGEAALPSQEPVRFSHDPNLAFPTSTITGFREEGGRRILSTEVLGLFGPQGPLPLHVTEYARERQRRHGDDAMVRFFDLFQHRMLTLFYRAWANAQPAASLERSDRDRLSLQFGSAIGVGTADYAGLDATSQHVKLRYLGLLAHQKRDAESLARMVSSVFRVEARIEQNVGEWLPLPASDHCRLGTSRTVAVLGATTQLGRRFWSVQHRFRLWLGPLSLAQLEALLPGTPGLARLTALVRSYLGDELDWDLQLRLRRDEVPEPRLGGCGQLGWTSWLGGCTRDPIAASDTRIQPSLRCALTGQSSTESFCSA